MDDQAMKADTLAGKWDNLNQIGFYGNVFVRIHKLAAIGDKHDGHQHNFDHVTLVAQGAIRVKWRRFKDNDPAGELVAYGTKDFHAPTFVTIDKDTLHEVTALEADTVWMCVYALPEGFSGDTSTFHSERNDPYVPSAD
jgi:hypothetical protein